MEKAVNLCRIAENDLRMYGDQYVEFGERSIRLLDPTKIKLTLNKKGKVKKALYGKSPIEAIFNRIKWKKN